MVSQDSKSDLPLAILLEQMHKKFDINQTKIKGGCQSGRKVDSKNDLPLVNLATRSYQIHLRNIHSVLASSLRHSIGLGLGYLLSSGRLPNSLKCLAKTDYWHHLNKNENKKLENSS